MRLTCPNCGAQYEVDPVVIPDDGRDVQCSSCGHTWFQLHPDIAGEPEEPPVEAALPRRPDPQVMRILQEEAARELAARRASAAPLESQPELDMGAPESRPRPSPAPTEQKAEPIGMAERAAAAMSRVSDAERARRAAPRRTLLPDIEEINTAIASNPEHGDDPALDADANRRAREARSRRMGFGIAVGIFAGFTLLYSQGPRVAERLPVFAPALNAYVTAIDSGRLWLDGALRAAVTPLSDTPDDAASES